MVIIIMCVAQYLLNEYVLSRQVEYRQWMELMSTFTGYRRCVYKVTKGERL